MYNQSEYEIYHLEKSARRIYKVCASKKTNTPEALIVVSIIQGESLVLKNEKLVAAIALLRVRTLACGRYITIVDALPLPNQCKVGMKEARPTSFCYNP